MGSFGARTVCWGAVTGGVKGPGAGLIDFSVGVSEDSVVVVGDCSGVSLSVLHAAVMPIIAMTAAPPTTVENRLVKVFDTMQCPTWRRCLCIPVPTVAAVCSVARDWRFRRVRCSQSCGGRTMWPANNE
ncbi:hypothetical protein MCHIJ_29970 [Mycolicibacterium chitae]|nr:hypothetical protein MCHIJ_29970 [Mycolicibacterium chitae]